MRNEKRIVRFIAVTFAAALVLICSSCSKTVSEVASVESQSDSIVASELEESFEAESIDISDVDGDIPRRTLVKIDELNHTIGKPLYVTKDDYLKGTSKKPLIL